MRAVGFPDKFRCSVSPGQVIRIQYQIQLIIERARRRDSEAVAASPLPGCTRSRSQDIFYVAWIEHIECDLPTPPAKREEMIEKAMNGDARDGIWGESISSPGKPRYPTSQVICPPGATPLFRTRTAGRQNLRSEWRSLLRAPRNLDIECASGKRILLVERLTQSGASVDRVSMASSSR